MGNYLGRAARKTSSAPESSGSESPSILLRECTLEDVVVKDDAKMEVTMVGTAGAAAMDVVVSWEEVDGRHEARWNFPLSDVATRKARLEMLREERSFVFKLNGTCSSPYSDSSSALPLLFNAALYIRYTKHPTVLILSDVIKSQEVGTDEHIEVVLERVRGEKEDGFVAGCAQRIRMSTAHAVRLGSMFVGSSPSSAGVQPPPLPPAPRPQTELLTPAGGPVLLAREGDFDLVPAGGLTAGWLCPTFDPTKMESLFVAALGSDADGAQLQFKDVMREQAPRLWLLDQVWSLVAQLHAIHTGKVISSSGSSQFLAHSKQRQLLYYLNLLRDSLSWSDEGPQPTPENAAAAVAATAHLLHSLPLRPLSASEAEDPAFAVFRLPLFVALCAANAHLVVRAIMRFRHMPLVWLFGTSDLLNDGWTGDDTPLFAALKSHAAETVAVLLETCTLNEGMQALERRVEVTVVDASGDPCLAPGSVLSLVECGCVAPSCGPLWDGGGAGAGAGAGEAASSVHVRKSRASMRASNRGMCSLPPCGAIVRSLLAFYPGLVLGAITKGGGFCGSTVACAVEAEVSTWGTSSGSTSVSELERCKAAFRSTLHRLVPTGLPGVIPRLTALAKLIGRLRKEEIELRGALRVDGKDIPPGTLRNIYVEQGGWLATTFIKEWAPSDCPWATRGMFLATRSGMGTHTVRVVYKTAKDAKDKWAHVDLIGSPESRVALLWHIPTVKGWSSASRGARPRMFHLSGTRTVESLDEAVNTASSTIKESNLTSGAVVVIHTGDRDVKLLDEVAAYVRQVDATEHALVADRRRECLACLACLSC